MSILLHDVVLTKYTHGNIRQDRTDGVDCSQQNGAGAAGLATGLVPPMELNRVRTRYPPDIGAHPKAILE
jgi:hypothetical protein